MPTEKGGIKTGNSRLQCGPTTYSTHDLDASFNPLGYKRIQVVQIESVSAKLLSSGGEFSWREFGEVIAVHILCCGCCSSRVERGVF